MSVFAEPKIDCHAHVLDPVNFPCGHDTAYKPSGRRAACSASAKRRKIEVISTVSQKHS